MKGKVAIYEVEVEVLSPMDDPSVMWLKAGEYRARVVQPTIFHQKVERTRDGKKETTLVPDMWYSFAFHDSYESALADASNLVRQEFEFNLRKYKTSYTEEDVAAAISAIELIALTS